ncbi:MAG: hypothetical protein MJ060_04590, partial [Clostridia bacterium]|nr:hypothetical protein [Clostridia bacterium]
SAYQLTVNVNPAHFKQKNKTNKSKNKCKNFLRRLALAGSSGALFACIPTQIVKEIPNLEYVALVHPETYPNNEWLLKFHTTDSI